MNFFRKNWAIILVVIIIIVIIVFSGNAFNTYIKDIESGYKKEIKTLEETNIHLRDSVISYKNELKNIENDEKSFYNDYLYERKKRIQAEKNVENIKNLVFDRPYLDSIAKYIRFR